MRGDCDCQHQGGRELELDGMVNKRESLINVVIGNKPKVLTGLNQKVHVRYWGFPNPSREQKHIGVVAGPK